MIVAVYNSEKTLRELVERLIDSFSSSSYSYEIVLVDDASTDKSFREILELHREHPFLMYDRHELNRGQSAALLTGLRHSTGDYIITIDDDLQYDPADIKRLIDEQALTSADIVYGIPDSKKEGLLKRLTVVLIKKVLSLVLRVPGKGSSFRLIKRSVFSMIATDQLLKNVLPEVLFFRLNLKIAYITVNHYKRKYGRSGYSFFKLARLTVNSIRTYLKN